MIDTIKIHIPNDKVPDDYYKTHCSLFKKWQTTSNDKGEKWGFGLHKNLRIHYSEWGLTVEGSLPKFKYGTNQYTLNLNDFVEVIDQLAVEFGLPLRDGKVTRIDVAENIFTVKPVEDYYKYFGDVKRLNRVVYTNGIEYKNSNRAIVIYGKIKELKKNNETITGIFQGKNVLRYEYRLLNNMAVSSVLSLDKATVNDVIHGYKKMIDTWIKSYLEIYKNHNLINFKAEAYRNVSGIEKQLMIAGIEKLGGSQYILDLIKQGRKDKLFKYANRATNLTRKLKGLLHTPILTEKSVLINELDNKVRISYLVANDFTHLWDAEHYSISI